LNPVITLVDDDPDFLEGMRAVLSGIPLELTMATDGIQGWRLLRRVQPALVLLDFDMPGLTGLELLQKVRASLALRSTPVLIFTAHADRSILYDGFAAGLDDFMQKPADAREARLRIERLLAARRSIFSASAFSGHAGPLLALRLDPSFQAAGVERNFFLKLIILHLADCGTCAWEFSEDMLLIALPEFNKERLERNFRAIRRYWKSQSQSKKRFRRAGAFLEAAPIEALQLRLFQSGLSIVTHSELAEFFESMASPFYVYS
jgi:CheY-like chemotaxis protein